MELGQEGGAVGGRAGGGGHAAATPSSWNAPSIAARISRGVCWAAVPAAVEGGAGGGFGEGPGGDHPGRRPGPRRRGWRGGGLRGPRGRTAGARPGGRGAMRCPPLRGPVQGRCETRHGRRGRRGRAGEGGAERGGHLIHWPAAHPPVRLAGARVDRGRRDDVPAVALDVDAGRAGQRGQGRAAGVAVVQVPAAPAGRHGRRRRHQVPVELAAVARVDIDHAQPGGGPGADGQQAPGTLRSIAASRAGVEGGGVEPVAGQARRTRPGRDLSRRCHRPGSWPPGAWTGPSTNTGQPWRM